MKKGIVLCEGTDDTHFLGYFLYKNSNQRIQRLNKSSQQYLSKRYNLDTLKAIEISYYLQTENKNRFALCAIGGKNRLNKILTSLYENILRIYIDEDATITDLLIVLDRDEDKIEDTISFIEGCVNEFACNKVLLENNKITTVYYKNELNDVKCFRLKPVIIPFNENGSIESLLMKAVCEKGENECRIIDNAIQFIDGIVEKGIAKHYLNHNRLINKAKFSSMIAVVNPDHSTSTLDNMLIHNEWNNSPTVYEHFKPVLDVIDIA